MQIHRDWHDISDFDWDIKPVKNGRKVKLDDNIYSFDTETATVYRYQEMNGHPKSEYWERFDPRRNNDEQNVADVVSYVVSWQFGINDDIFVGRELDDFTAFIEILSKKWERAGCYGVIYVHNFGFDFEFLRNVISDWEVFARKPREPMYAITKTYSCIFRDSAVLSGASLARTAKEYHLPVTKKVGEWDYAKIRTPLTPLTDNEYDYAAYDCLVIYEFIRYMHKEYGDVTKIPLTQTGRVRKVAKAILSDRKYMRRVSSLQTIDTELYRQFTRATRGGDCHANVMHVDTLLYNVISSDESSAYPGVMVSRYYPMSRFSVTPTVDLAKLDGNYAYLIDVIFYQMSTRTPVTYISASKCTELSTDAVLDNGRVVKCDCVRLTMTDVDYDIIRRAYKWQNYEILTAYKSRYGLLPTPYVDYIMQLYDAKTSLKQSDDDPDFDETKYGEYTRSKQYINALYGMMLTSPLNPDVKYTENEWQPVTELTNEEVTEKLREMSEPYHSFLAYQWGIWVTAWARHNLYDVIFVDPKNCVYNDTDSIKHFASEKIDKAIAAYNKANERRVKANLKAHGIDRPCTYIDYKGVAHTIGNFEPDGVYEQFITFGAKKYAYVDSKARKLGITVSGLNKKLAVNEPEIAECGLRGFRNDKVFGIEYSGRLTSRYAEEQPEIDVYDEEGNKYHAHHKIGVSLIPTTYTLHNYPNADDIIMSMSAVDHTGIDTDVADYL